MPEPFLWKPQSDSNGNLVVLMPSSMTGQIGSVYVVTPDGQRHQGRFSAVANGGRAHFRFDEPGGAYPQGSYVEGVLDSGESVRFDVGNTGARNEGGTPTNIDGSPSTFQGSSGGGSQTITSAGGNSVAIPNFVNFNPADYYISLQQAVSAGRAEGKYNIGQYTDNFDKAEKFAMDTIETEAKGLESFLPRSSKLIRQADAQNNVDKLAASEVFDARNQSAARKATLGNVQLRRSIFEQQFPGIFKSQNDIRSRTEGDVSRIRRREAEPYLDEVIKETAARSARNNAADISASGGYGINSGAGTNLVDRFDFDTRIKLRDAEIQNARAGDQAISNAESSVQNAITGSQNMFTGVIAPGIQDFKASQPEPTVTDIGAKINPMPTVDAGTIRRNVTNDLTNISTLAPSQVFSGSIDTQKYNSGVGLQALGFQQMQNNVIASAANSAVALDKGDEIRQQQIDQFQQGLDSRNESEGIQGGIGLATTGLGVLGQLINGYQSLDPNTPEGQAAQTGISGFLTDFANTIQDGYNTASTYLNDTFGLDIGQFDVGDQASPGLDFGGIFETSSQTGSAGGDAYLNSLNQGVDLGSTIDTSDLASDTFDYSLSSTSRQAEDFQLDPISSTNNHSFGSETSQNFNLGEIKSVASGVQSLSTSEVTNSFLDSKTRGGILSKGPALGISAQTIVQGWNLYDKWGSMSDAQKGPAAAQFLTSLASQTGLIEGSVPGAVTGLLTQGANLYSNYDKLTPGQRAQLGIQTSGALGTLAATIGGAGGPVGTAIAFGASAFGRAANTAITQGVNGRDAFNVLANPLTSYGVDYANNLTGGNLSQRDATNASMLMNPLTTPIAIADQIFNLDLDFTSGKPKTQQFRDALRKGLETIGVASNEEGSHKIKLADGSSFDIGKDGKNKLQNKGKNIDGKTERHYYDVDFSNPLAPEVVGWTNALSRVLFRSEAGSKFVGHLTNAAMSSNPDSLASSKANLQTFAADAGIDYNAGVQVLTKLRDAKQLSQADYDAYRNGWMSLMLTK